MSCVQVLIWVFTSNEQQYLTLNKEGRFPLSVNLCISRIMGKKTWWRGRTWDRDEPIEDLWCGECPSRVSSHHLYLLLRVS